MSYLPLIIQLVSGVVGSNVVGNAVKSLNLGPVGNTIVGLIGGGIGGQLITALGAGAGGSGGLDVGTILASIGGGAAGGGALTAIVSYLKLMFAKPT
jgi:hypothetical protein